MKYKLYANKDTYINSYYDQRNYGAEQVLEISANGLSSARVVQRALIQFDLNSLSSVKNNNLFPSNVSSVSSATLVLYNTIHADALVEDEYIYLYPLTASWTDGRGLGKSFADYGYANYTNRTKNNLWGTSGGDFSTNTNYSASSYSDYGTEDLRFDVTSLVKAWSASSLTNNGVILKLSDAAETATANYGYKKVYSENTHTYFIPYIEFDYNREELNDRHSVWTDTAQRLYTDHVTNYNTLSSNLSSNVQVLLYGFSSVSVTSWLVFPTTKWTLTSITATNGTYGVTITSTTGIFVAGTASSLSAYVNANEYLIGSYTASFDSYMKKYYVDINVSSACASYESYVDRWVWNGLTSENSFYVYNTGIFDREYNTVVKSLNKKIYRPTEIDRVRVFIQDRASFNLTPTTTLNRDFYNLVLKDVYYEITDVNNFVWVPKTLCSRGKEYNYFYLLCDQLPDTGEFLVNVYYVVQGVEYKETAGRFKVQ